VLWGTVGVNLGLLGFYKYANFAVENLNHALTALGMRELEFGEVHLPIGISFFTFQALSYVVDVHRRNATAERNPLNVGLYISMFPQLIAGPIVRYTDVAASIKKRAVCLSGAYFGVKRFVIGLAKKVFLANTFARTADFFFSADPSDVTCAGAWLGLLCYAMQIYYDFSGYSDMAIGLGRILGFRFHENFRYPYISTSVREFWRRWHISLSTWLRDYLYIPLGGSRGSLRRTYFNLAIVFVLCGLWHGASWTFVIWGLLHGMFIVLERIGLDRLIKKLWRPLQHLYLLVVVLMTWVIFRADSIPHAVSYVAALCGIGGSGTFDLSMQWTPALALAIAIGVLGCTPVWMWGLYHLLRAERKRVGRSRAFAIGLRGATESLLFIGCVLVCAMLLASGSYNPFIYFRF
jgi:alginate O-acetyltransferase complex protein AlgI